MSALKNLRGQTFGLLTAKEYVGGGKWRCGCECGGEAVAITSNLLKGNSTSCGCKRRASKFKHGMTNHSIYRVWIGMKSRCNNPDDPAFHNYGGRGVTVCERWREFPNFLADMGMRPPGYEIDRIDNDGNYEPGNCRWVTSKSNKHNKRTNHMITWKGETFPLTLWAERLGVHPRTLFNRIGRGWTLERAMTRKVQIKRTQKKGTRT